ncbi:MAG: hypothetical protein ACR5LH_06270, partial [Sodalis sp. (in: enterobacteria)]
NQLCGFELKFRRKMFTHEVTYRVGEVRISPPIRWPVSVCHYRQLKADTPRQDLVFLLTNLVDSSSVFAQDAGSFARLKQFFTAFSRVVLSVYTLEPPTRGDNGT